MEFAWCSSSTPKAALEASRASTWWAISRVASPATLDQPHQLITRFAESESDQPYGHSDDSGRGSDNSLSAGGRSTGRSDGISAQIWGGSREDTVADLLVIGLGY